MAAAIEALVKARVTVKVLVDHDTSLPMHDVLQEPWITGKFEYRDRAGRRGSTTHQWMTVGCQHADCPYHAIVRSSDLGALVAALLKGRTA